MPPILHEEPPKSKQCNNNQRVIYESLGGTKHDAIAFWYPQMGGYTAKAVAWREDGGCFNIAVWHNGNFPFQNDEPPRYLHHCSASDFIHMGEILQEADI